MTAAEEDAEIYRRASEAFSGDNPTAEVLVQESTETVFGRSASWSYIRKRIRKFPRRPLLALFSLLSVQLDQGRHPLDAVLQYRVTQRLADESRRSRGLLRRLREEPHRVVISEEQLGILAAVAISYAEGEQWPPDGNMTLLEALLAFNSLRYSEIESRTSDATTRLLFTEVRASVTDVGNKAEVLKRWGAFASWARTDAARASRTYIDLDGLFERALGMSYLDFAASMFAFYSNFGAPVMGPGGDIRNYPFLDTAGFLASVERPETLQRWLRQVSVGMVDAKNRLLASQLYASIASLVQFMATPLLIDGEATYCPALRYLPNAAGEGLLFRLGQFLEASENRMASDRLRSFYGDFLESYVTDFMREATRSRGCSIFRERTFGKSEERTSDIAIFDHEDAIFIDVNSKRFNVTHSVLALDLDWIRRDLESMIVAKLRKIAKRAREFRSGRLAYEGVRNENIKRITGIVVTPQGLTRLVGISQELDAMLPSMPDGLDQWEFFDLSEVETLPQMFDGDLSIGDLVERKRRDEAGRRRSLTNYLWLRERDRLSDRRTDEDRLVDPWFQEVLARAQSWGLRGDRQ